MKHEVLGVVLAGGRSNRFGSDKASAMLGKKSLLDHVVDRAAPQVGRLLVNRNDNIVCTLSSGYLLLPDAFPGEGPLAGVLAGLEYARIEEFPVVMTFACDTPFFPGDMVTRLHAGLAASEANVCVAKCGDEEHYTFGLWRTSCAPLLSKAFADGQRSLHGAASIVGKVAVNFPLVGDGPDGNVFFNINTACDRGCAEKWMGRC